VNTFDVGRDNFDLRVSAAYTLWDHGRRKIRLDKARTSREASEADLRQREQDLVLQIVQAYHEVLQAKALVELDEELLELSRGNADKVRAFVEAENAIPADIAAAEVRVADDELALVGDQNALELARAELPAVLGLDPRMAIEIAEDPGYGQYVETGAFARHEASLDATIDLALSQRPEIAESLLGLRVLALEHRRAGRERWPRLTADLGFAVDLDEYLREREDFSRFRTWDATARVAFPIFDGGVTKRGSERAELDVEIAREQHAALERAIALDAKQAYLNLTRAEKRLEITGVQVRDAQLSLEAATVRMEQELAILLEVLDAQTQFGAATTNRVRAYHDYKVAQQVLAHAIGERVR